MRSNMNRIHEANEIRKKVL